MLVAVCGMRWVATAANVLSVLGERKAHPNSTDHGPCPLLHTTYRHARDGRSVQHLEGETRHVVCRGMSYSAGRVEEKKGQASPCLAREAPAHDDDAASSVQADRPRVLSRRNRCNV